MNKYNQRVREIAEEMAKQAYPNQWERYPDLPHILEEYIQKFIPAARIAVKHIADTAERFYQHGWLRGKKGLPVATEEEIELDFIARGLIPSPDQPEGTGKPNP